MLPCPGSNVFIRFCFSDSCVCGCYVYPAAEDVFVVSEVLLEECGNRKRVRALLHALSALHAFLYLRHHRLPFGTELALGWRASYELHHSCALIDLYSLRTRHAVAAAAAELGGEFLPVGINNFLEFWRERRRICVVTQPFVEVVFIKRIQTVTSVSTSVSWRPWGYFARDITQEKP